ncbi:hypothetical protein LTS18_003584 [Coniosporium uncinatum]|uniref:Uncharacterized protein n=1 Tax=Coniosporium uncinatum TaxID=93489 RepID=A0ACC3DBL9_9PEZI|nr:hypothetical protein LTS18_003584 [Coniosporium uncinatum]
MGGRPLSPANPFMSDDAFSPVNATASSGWGGLDSFKGDMSGFNNFSATNDLSSAASTPSIFKTQAPFSHGGYIEPQSAFMQPQQMHMGVSPIQTNFPKEVQTYRQQHGQITPPSASSFIHRPSSNSMEDAFGSEDSSHTSRRRSTQYSKDGVKTENNGSPVNSQQSASKKKRRGRKAKDAQHDDQDEQRQKFLERNRLAATKCRQKKKAWTNGLEDRARNLTAERTYLKAMECQLRQEILELKSRCLEHADCNCQAIRNYLNSTVATMRPPMLNDYAPSSFGAQPMDTDLMAHFGSPPNFNEPARSKSTESHRTTEEEMAEMLTTENAKDDTPA